MHNEEMWKVRATDGHEIELRVQRPSGDPKASMLFVAALGVESKYYKAFGAALADAGILAAMADLRGNGTSTLRPSRRVNFGYREIVELDIPAAVDVMQQRAGAPLYIGGHSLGGQLSLLHAAANPVGIAGVTLVACACPYRKFFSSKESALLRITPFLFPILGAALGYIPGKQLGFGGNEARGLMQDWSNNANTGQYKPRGSNRDYEAALGNLTLPIVTVNIAGDTMGPPTAVDFVLGKAPTAPSQRVEVALSEAKPGAHFRWAKEPGGVVRALGTWLGDETARDT